MHAGVAVVVCLSACIYELAAIPNAAKYPILFNILLHRSITLPGSVGCGPHNGGTIVGAVTRDMFWTQIIRNQDFYNLRGNSGRLQPEVYLFLVVIIDQRQLHEINYQMVPRVVTRPHPLCARM